MRTVPTLYELTFVVVGRGTQGDFYWTDKLCLSGHHYLFNQFVEFFFSICTEWSQKVGTQHLDTLHRESFLKRSPIISAECHHVSAPVSIIEMFFARNRPPRVVSPVFSVVNFLLAGGGFTPAPRGRRDRQRR